ncbi:ABC transporter substrate-binding protein [Halorhodospira halophila]|uniref:Solute binding protein-like protein n=1 Tax=Halorhodospira halophila (strain DSM 244 / SL1) TaxID=349124 RepID=A1WVY8_HALHL|nr:ABC transporter substrate-binding protein [Halorhodospira halophila]ABM61850.1 solute binding protein-like protein [Halorhodospira halophila SL1]MBK1729836.1 ABC transporter substrate-binding protein [Halorhodospira halophila]
MAPRTYLPLAVLALIAGAIAAVLMIGEQRGADTETSNRGEPGEPADRRGALVDEVVFTEESDPGRLTALIEHGSHHLFTQGIDSATIFRQAQDSDQVGHFLSHGTAIELTLNPAAFEDDQRLNPFQEPRIREALNRLVDRRYVAEELFGGLAVPRYLPINTAFPDYARLAETARSLELEYRHDPDRAEATIAEEMEALGAERRGGRWYYQGEPVTLSVLIRTEDNRERVGDYIANLMEDLGFAVERLYRTAEEASRIWMTGDPAAGRWHIYTGAWVSTVINRDIGDDLNYYYTPRGRPDPLWQAYDPTEAFSTAAERLERRDYSSVEERQTLMKEGLELAMENSARIWLVDQLSVWPHAADLEVAGDLAGGLSGSQLWPFTLRFSDRVGGRVVAATPSMLTEPWNPVAGSNWIFDRMILRGLTDSAVLPDPFTGLYWPQRIESAEVTVTEDAPVSRTLDWVSLETTEEIEIPGDAWIDWDPEEQRILTVDDRHEDGLTARSRVVLHYEDDYLERRWHDGSQVSVADVVLPWILSFARADEDSPLFDPSHLPEFEVYQRNFRGWRMIDTDPLTVEVYSDQVYPDAENLVAARIPGALPWHVLNLGIQAERGGELAFSSSKADRMDVEWLNLVSGPSLEILRGYLQAATESEQVPFEDVLGTWLREGEAAERYRALGEWHRERGHFWVDDGPFYLHSVRPVEGSIVLRRYADHPDPSDKWLRFTDPRIPELEIDGPLLVERGDDLELTVRITYAGEAYPGEEIEAARFLLFDKNDQLVLEREAEPAAGGEWHIRVPAEELEALGTGANSLELAVTSQSVALPAFATHAFATLPAGEAEADGEEEE